VSGASKGVSQLSLPATYLQHPGRWETNLVQDELLDALLPHRELPHETSLLTRSALQSLADDPPGSPYPML
jgi:hypothetical protein